MTCPVCKRELAPTLSICLTCGAMMNDTVREELQTKIGPPAEIVRNPAVSPPPRVMSMPVAAVGKVEPPPPVAVKSQTSELGNKKTSPTLVEFQNRNATLPDWRLQLQNSVRQRKSDVQAYGETTDDTQPAFQKQLVTNGANALKPQFVEAPDPIKHENPRVARALRRIEDSRRAFSAAEIVETAVAPPKSAPGRNYPFNVVSRSVEIDQRRKDSKATVNTVPKPKLVSSLRIEKRGFDTNKLPPIPRPPIAETPNGEIRKPISASLKLPATVVGRTEFHEDEVILRNDVIDIEETENGDVDDLAPLSSRFTAGLFDAIIGAFATAIVLSPALVSGATWLSVSGIFAMAAAFGIVMFIYLTASIGFRNRTIGMKIFSLEIVDAEENEFPTLHQAAVSSAVFLLSMPLLGISFLPVLFNEEKRAAHDLLSGTIMIREI